jgi:hypothetical protein
MRTGGVPCSFDQWVKYVQEKEDSVNYPPITNQPYEEGVYPDFSAMHYILLRGAHNCCICWVQGSELKRRSMI